MKATIEARIEALETIRHEVNSALPLIDYRWTGPEVAGLAFMVEGQAVIERLPVESDAEYQERARDICQHTHRGRTLPLLQVHLGG